MWLVLFSSAFLNKCTHTHVLKVACLFQVAPQGPWNMGTVATISRVLPLSCTNP